MGRELHELETYDSNVSCHDSVLGLARKYLSLALSRKSNSDYLQSRSIQNQSGIMKHEARTRALPGQWSRLRVVSAADEGPYFYVCAPN